MNFSEVFGDLKALETKLASINANWNGQGPDLMSPAEVEGLRSTLLSFNQQVGIFLLKAGGCLANGLATGRAA